MEVWDLAHIPARAVLVLVAPRVGGMFPPCHDNDIHEQTLHLFFSLSFSNDEVFKQPSHYLMHCAKYRTCHFLKLGIEH